MSKLMMYAFDNNSESGDAVAKALGIKKVAHQGSKFIGGPDTTVINWGSSSLPKSVKRCRVINQDSAVAKAINKRSFFQWTEGKARTVPWTTDLEVAKQWLAEGLVYSRTKIESYEGQGIIVSGVNEELPKAKLYTKEIKSDKEYRVHIVNKKIIIVHRKVPMNIGSIPNGVIKNTQAGWGFKRVTIYPNDIEVQALAAINAVGLDFGACDILYKDNKGYVLEINTAPSIYDLSFTLKMYSESFKELINGLQN